MNSGILKSWLGLAQQTATAVVACTLFVACSSNDSSAPPFSGGSSGGSTAPATGGTKAPATGGSAAPVTGGGGSAAGSTGAASGATLTAVTAILGNTSHNCTICHSGSPTSFNGGLMFNPTDKTSVYNALVGKMSGGPPNSMCAGKTYVVAGSPSTSLLLEKVGGHPTCGGPMPMGSAYAPLNTTEIQTISDWITAGAPNN
jgi:hypothetical protein